MGTYIREFFEEKRKEWIFGILSDSSFRNHCGHLMVDSTKTVRSIKSWAWKNFSVEFFIIFGRDATIKEEEGMCWRKRLCFHPLPPPLPNHTTEVTQQGKTSLSFWNDYLGKGVEESQFVRQGRMVSGGFPRGFRRFSICQSVDGFDRQRGWWWGNFRNNITSLRGSGSKDNQYRPIHRKIVLIGREHHKLTFGSQRRSHNQLRGCYGDLAHRYNGGGQYRCPWGEHTLCWSSSDWGGGLWWEGLRRWWDRYQESVEPPSLWSEAYERQPLHRH